jgi:hypothetical protein
MTGIQSPSLHHEGTPFLPCNYSPAHAGASAATAVGLPSSNRDAILKYLRVLPVPFAIARSLIVRHHYLHSLPGGTMLSFGVFVGKKLLGAVTLGAGPYLAYQIVEGAKPDDCITLTRLWLADELPSNSESRVLGMIMRSLRKETGLKFVVTYSDPANGHIGYIYQATNWLYTGLSSATPLYDIGNGIAFHSRTLAHSIGSHSIKYLAGNGVDVKIIPQAAKHRYVYFLDRSWLARLRVPTLDYPKKKEGYDGDR